MKSRGGWLFKTLRFVVTFGLIMLTMFSMILLRNLDIANKSSVYGEDYVVEEMDRETFKELDEEYNIEYYVGEDFIEYDEKGQIKYVEDNVTSMGYKVVDENQSKEEREKVKEYYKVREELIKNSRVGFFVSMMVGLMVAVMYVRWTSS